MNGMPPMPGRAGMGGHRPTPQQILQMLMQMDPEKRAETLNRNPQLRVFLQTIERQKSQVPAKANEPAIKRHSEQQVKSAKGITQIPGIIPTNHEFGGNSMPDVTEWSHRLENSDLDVPMELQLYESMIRNDKHYQDWAFDNRRPDLNAKLLQKMMGDYNYYKDIKINRMKSISKNDGAEIDANSMISKMWGDGYSGYGNGVTGNKVSVVYPIDNKMGDGYCPASIEKSGTIIPIRLEFDVDRDNFKLNDTLTWDLNDTEDMIVEIVNQMIIDYKIPGNREAVFKKILHSFKEQISVYESLPSEVDENANADIRIPIILDITIANNQLNDKFEWALNSTDEEIIEFANLLCDELALPAEFKTAVAHSMKEQCQLFIKSLYMVGYKWDGSPIVSEDIKEHVKIAGIDEDSIFHPRSELADFGANVQELTVDQFEKIVKERERELRRKKRTATRGRRGGFVLPDLSDMPKTFRTPIPNGSLPGAVDFGVEVDGYVEMLAGIDVPMKQQMERAKELERMQRSSAQLQEERELVKRWMRLVVERRMRGATLGAGVRYNNGEVVIKFAWR